ncbi:hypothetical protein K3M67_04910 [Sphingobium sp. V4]|uniref:hypothetical protein n=1 Tax=Sphingobium sp. V4 TaxID=3038927 RepID=UPI0025581C8E|nr:hypothetical protein [Sphingobium sp. V4]WIW89318.1 hypothetical protein K3M67_04910 [Sphingobium sp. V4]
MIDFANIALTRLIRLRRLMAEPVVDVTPEVEQAPPFFMVWRPSGKPPMKCHTARDVAEGEAERVARLNPGHDVFVLAPATRVRAQMVEREDFGQAHPLGCLCPTCDQIPF